ncbi:MAG: tryptophan 7-halogenase [Pseudoxanthomonas sp.]
MNPDNIASIVVAGGGSAGWSAAAALARHFPHCRIALVESEEIGIVGVGEATVPNVRSFNEKVLGLEEGEFVRSTQATFKLGIEFRDWGRLGQRYMHGFGAVGYDMGPIAFHHLWRRALAAGRADPDVGRYCLQNMAAARGRFMTSPSDAPANSPLADIAYAYHFDAALYARYLRARAEKQGVVRHEGRIVDVQLRPQDGFVQALVMEDGRRIEGELFVDCSGFRSLLLGQALGVPWLDWGHWLPCDRAVAVPCDPAGPPEPFTRSTARQAGWQWHIPLQHRVGNGHVYSSAFLDDAQAAATLLANLDGPARAEPRLLRFATGRRERFWERNVVALGLASGFMEPLESTSILLVHNGLLRLLDVFPDRRFDPALARRYNEATVFEWERIRDFLILHYKATARDDTAFWRHCAAMAIPDTLQEVIELFQGSGRYHRNGAEFFAVSSWLQVMVGQGIVPHRWHPLLDEVPEQQVFDYVQRVAQVIDGCVQAMPTHQQFIDRHCKAPAP